MDIHRADHDRTHQQRSYRPVLRRLLTDILPTLLLLLAMALGMSLVARYAESAHVRSVFASHPFQQELD